MSSTESHTLSDSTVDFYFILFFVKFTILSLQGLPETQTKLFTRQVEPRATRGKKGSFGERNSNNHHVPKAGSVLGRISPLPSTPCLLLMPHIHDWRGASNMPRLRVTRKYAWPNSKHISLILMLVPQTNSFLFFLFKVVIATATM